MPKLRILILTDGRPGHFNISEGIAAALARRFETTVDRLEVRRGRWSGLVLATLVNGGLSPSAILTRIYGLDLATVPQADLIVSAGAETLAANAALARLRAVPNIFYGSLRSFAARNYTLALTSYANQVRHPNQAMALKPSRIDADRLPPREPRTQMTIGLLVGGDGGRVVFDEQDWTRLTDFLASARQAMAIRWVVTNSRRTPDIVSDRLAKLALGPTPVIHTYMDVRHPETGTLQDLFTVADALVVTTDSSTMISEAVQLRRPVIAIAPKSCWLPPDETRYRSHMTKQRWLANIRIEELSPPLFLRALEQIHPMQDNALDTLADLITARIPTLAQRQDRS
ncbi:MAG: hypothetical protein RLZ98_3597 [Pseudomonadota bacterium]